MWTISRSRRIPGCRWWGISLVRARSRGICLSRAVIPSIIRLLREREIRWIILIVSLLRWIAPLHWVCFPVIPLRRIPLLCNLRSWRSRPQARRRPRLWSILTPPIWRSANNHGIRRGARRWDPLPQALSLLRPTSKYCRGGLGAHMKHFWFWLD